MCQVDQARDFSAYSDACWGSAQLSNVLRLKDDLRPSVKDEIASIVDETELLTLETQEPKKTVVKWQQPFIWASNEGPPPVFFRTKTAGHRYWFFHESFRHPMG